MNNLTNQDHVRQLEMDIDNLKWRLERLKEDYAAWERTLEQEDLETIQASLIQMEYDVDIMFATCFALFLSEHDSAVDKSLHHVHNTLNSLFQDVKRARDKLNKAYMERKDLTQMEIDWGRLKKTTTEVVSQVKASIRSA